MNLWLRIAISLVAGAGGGLLTFAVTFYLVATLASCPPDSVCDLPAIAGVGLGLLVGPIAGIGVAWLSFRRLRRGRTDISARAS
jgi:hypothetical protein